MRPRTYIVDESFSIKGRGTVVCLQIEDGVTPTVGSSVEIVYPNGRVFCSVLTAVEVFMVSPPPPVGKFTPVGIMLADDPGVVPSGSRLRTAA